MKKKLCILFSLCLTLFFSIHTIKASDILLDNIEINVTIHHNGSAHIKEVWDIELYEGTEIYKSFNQMGDSILSNLSVRDEKGFKYKNIGEWDSDVDKEYKDGKCGIISDEDNYEICFGIGEYGKREYTIEYDISHFVHQYVDYQGLNYAFFSDMELEPQHVRITVTSPYEFNENNCSIWGFGYNGQVRFENNNIMMETDELVPEGGKMQLLMRLERSLFDLNDQHDESFQTMIDDALDSSDYDEDIYEQDGYYSSFVYHDNDNFEFVMICFTFGIGMIFLATFMINVFKKEGMDNHQFEDQIPLKNSKEIPLYKDIPCQKNMFLFYYLTSIFKLLPEDNESGLIEAILLKWIKNRYIEFKSEKAKMFFILPIEKFSIDLDRTIPVENQLEQDLLEFFIEAAGSNQLLETGEFEKWCKCHYEDILQWFDNIIEYIENDLCEKGLLKIEKTDKRILGIKIPQSIHIYHPSLRDEVEHIIGFKHYLETIENGNMQGTIDVQLWEDYLVFASILGITNEIQEHVGKVCPQFDDDSYMQTHHMHMIHTFSHNSISVAHQTNGDSSDGSGGFSSFGGGGGGFSGGGGGGVR